MNWILLAMSIGSVSLGLYLVKNRKAEARRNRSEVARKMGEVGRLAAESSTAASAAAVGVLFVIIGCLMFYGFIFPPDR